MAPFVGDTWHFSRQHLSRQHRVWQLLQRAADARLLILLVVAGASIAGPSFSIAADAADSLPRLKQALKSNDEKVRIGAMDALARMGPGAKGAVVELAAELEDKSPACRAH